MSGKESPFPDHEGKATRGDRIVPLAEFDAATRTAGERLGDTARAAARTRFLEAPRDATEVEGPFERIVVFGGVYNNHHALAALLEAAQRHGAEAIYCLGDLGGFGPNPEKVHPLLVDHGVRVIQGNYEQSLASGAEDCNCGYTDPRDNHFAELSYRYTERNCSDAFKRWMGALPQRRRVRVGAREWLLVHGSPRRVNEFLFESTSPLGFLETLLARERCEGLLCTHTGLPWRRSLPSGGEAVNVGVIGRPANDGSPRVTYTLVEGDEIRQLPLAYDHEALAAEMREEQLPEEFVETILSGWWTTCLEILPARERERSRY